MFTAVFDHYTIKVKSLENSVEFYERVLRLTKISNRTNKDHIRWFSLGNRSELHIVEGNLSGIKTNVGVHLALRLRNFDTFINHLKENGVTPHNSKGNPEKITTRADGIRQVYFQDPDGYWIEVNEAEILNQ